jgi:ABC-type polysaccharide/polyol phosphate export permease
VLLHGRTPEVPLLGLVVLLTVVVCVGGFAYFRRAEREFADII